jgi:hypothetical protein
LSESSTSTSPGDIGVFRLVGVIFTIVGIVALVASSAFMVVSFRGDQERTATATAVISNVFSRSSNRSISCGLTFTFVVNGKTYYGGTGSTSNSAYCSYQSGQEVMVYYNPAQPSDVAFADSRAITSIGALAFLGGAVVFAAIGIGLIVLSVKRTRKNRSKQAADEEPTGVNLGAPPTEGWQTYPGPGGDQP